MEIKHVSDLYMYDSRAETQNTVFNLKKWDRNLKFIGFRFHDYYDKEKGECSFETLLNSVRKNSLLFLVFHEPTEVG